jgi:5-methylcytosine-specific restriction endonuclease McrA
MTDVHTHARPIVRSMSDIPSLPACCQATRERNYRRGYVDGWHVAVWSLRRFLPDWLWKPLTRFFAGELVAWRHRGIHPDCVPWEDPPRFIQKLPRGRDLGETMSKTRLRFAILKRDQYRCQICGVAASDGLHVRLHVDHILAKALGGSDDPRNLQTTCNDCNWGKGTQAL